MIRRPFGGLSSVDTSENPSTTFDGIALGRPATTALVEAGYASLADLPADLDPLSRLHGVGPSTLRRLRAARSGPAPGGEHDLTRPDPAWP